MLSYYEEQIDDQAFLLISQSALDGWMDEMRS